MKFAVVGVGGVGGYFGGRLAADGNEVVFLARGAHREAMQREGLRVLSPKGDLHIAAPELFESAEQTGFCDLVLLCVKLWDVAEAAETIRPLLSQDSAVVPLQNGVEVEDQLTDLLGARHVVGGVAYIAAAIEAPGVIRHTGTMARLAFGERDGMPSWRMDALHAACGAAGIEAELSPDIERRIWEKFVMLAPLAGATCYDRCTVGEVIADPARRARFEAMVREAAAVGRAKGVALEPDLEARTLAAAARMPADMKTSMLHDLAAGHRLELPWLGGAVVRLGHELGVDTPANAAVVEALGPYAMGRRSSA